ncbi:MAG: FMN-binding protein [Bacteroidetes bacterium]|nr:FMN-binding protein [Bacteroidota bacterium]
MNIKKIIFFLVMSSFLSSAGEISDRTELTIKEYFGSDINLSKYKISLSQEIRVTIQNECRQKFFSDYIYVWKIDHKDHTTHYAVLDNVMGKTQPITFLVIFDSRGMITNSSVVKYREQHGGGVKEAHWLDQFIGLNGLSEFELGKNIDSISGATISSRSMTLGIRKLSLLFNYLKEKV